MLFNGEIDKMIIGTGVDGSAVRGAPRGWTVCVSDFDLKSKFETVVAQWHKRVDCKIDLFLV